MLPVLCALYQMVSIQKVLISFLHALAALLCDLFPPLYILLPMTRAVQDHFRSLAFCVIGLFVAVCDV